MESRELYLRVSKPEIIAFVAILNGYDNMFSVRTVDARIGLLHVILGYGCEIDGMAILEALRTPFDWHEHTEAVTGDTIEPREEDACIDCF